MRVGLVLGAGGVMGGAWLTGGLKALADETGWDPSSAEVIVGTSAGAMMGTLAAAGVPPWFMVAHSSGEVFEGLKGPDGRTAAEADRSGGAVFRLHRGLPSLGPGSWRMGAATLASPHRHSPAAVLTGWLPRGLISTEPLKSTVRRALPDGEIDRDGLWIVACDYRTGRRVAFGREGSPPAEVADAVAASCAIPGFYRPVEIGGRPYVDGGVCSASNLDLVKAEDLDLVICLNPTSSRHRTSSRNPLDRVSEIPRAASGRRLGYEARKVRAGGAEVVLIQPTARDLTVMGRNLMSRRRRHETVETAIETVGEQLRAPGVRERLRDLPPGEPHKLARPPGPPSEWPELTPAVRRARVRRSAA
jgi:NTE family protein